jgi:SAM-dependent methyltransferase
LDLLLGGSHSSFFHVGEIRASSAAIRHDANVVRHPLFAALYDRLFEAPEKAGLREMRGEFLAVAAGRTLELGAGTGLDLPHYGPGVTELVLSEPDPHMAKRLRDAVAEADLPAPAEVVEAPAEALPFGAASFDTVVCGLVLCTVDDPDAAIREIARVLRPGGKFLFLEHVRAQEGSSRARWQDRLERPWGFFAGGCHPNRRTIAALESAPLKLERMEMREFPTPSAALIRPLAMGVAVRAS